MFGYLTYETIVIQVTRIKFLAWGKLTVVPADRLRVVVMRFDYDL